MAGYHNHNWAWNVVGVRGSHYVVLLALVNESGGKGLVEKIRLATLARRCNLTEERVRAITRDLRAWDLIHSESRNHVNGRQLANAYRLNRDRMYPKETGSTSGETVGYKIWAAVLEKLDKLRGSAEMYLLRSQIHHAFFDSSDRETKTKQRRGALYLIASTDVVNEAFRDNVKWFSKVRDVAAPYVVEHFQLVHHVAIPEE